LSLLASGDLFKEYLGLLFWPKDLNPLFLPEAVPSFKDVQLWLPFLLLVTTFALLFKWRRLPFFWFSFFAIFLIPVLNIIPLPVMMASRYLYISQIGIWVLLALLLNWLIQFLRPFQLVRMTVWAAFGCWLIFITSQTLENTKVWRNSYTLWSYAIEKNFFNPLAHCNLGHWFHEQNMLGRSAHEHLIATLIRPNYHYSLSGLATYYYQKRKWDLAVEALYKGLNAAPDSKEILNNLGKVLIETGQSRRALFMFYRASYANPKNPEAFTNIVIWYVRANQPDEALAVAQTMVKNFPDLAEGYFRVGQALEAKGDLEGAMKAWEEGRKKPLLEDRILKMIDDRMIAARQKQTQRPLAGS
jgi:tetratricopeptide (TPR) repeat protein